MARSRRVSTAAALWLLIAGAGLAPARGQLLFTDGVESGTICAWSNAPSDFEVADNGLDDDCDGQVDEPDDVCDTGLPSGSGDPFQYAAALDLCRSGTSGGWGVLSGALTLADGTGSPSLWSRSLRPAFGTGNAPLAGDAFVVLSSGTAAAPGQTNPGHFAFQPGWDSGTTSPAPADWLAANGGVFPNLADCPEPSGVAAVNPVMLTFQVRVPDNAHSFAFAVRYLGSEFPEWVCSPFHDFFVALLESAYAGPDPNPADENLAFYRTPGGVGYPLGVALAWGETGLFTECVDGPTGCGPGAVAGNITTCAGTAGIDGTGMDVINPQGPPGVPGWCGTSNRLGGATSWLWVRGNVVPGEIIGLRLALWDVSDAFYDSVVLLDAFHWSTANVEPGATPQ